ncbi:hypothetical protein LYSHEL_12010 [Lysobacter helvus]|uniref:NYN domain-containing protein n=2 Tax=Lysobacteraceae TaxID=32033 RepID=A0ABN6FVZ9_9GAMM|nr:MULTISPECIES: NYN domain-containing protein [Lysobacter]BCT92177.1 hypothetical protein LYSCAS_12010 [Lysobacter caseinilyticus]BCT95330.1 hypothetical protein LYSHEL_12010 [Lysobacter helvus]
MAKDLPTAVYVDGHNLYYGRIRGTSFKWLDLVGLFDRLIHDQNPASLITQVRYFSAPAIARLASHGAASVIAQQDYHRAMRQRYGARFDVTWGAHTFDRKGTLLPRFVEGVPYDRKDRVRVWKLEEKQTDVNLALAMYRDACSGAYGQLVVCTNDSDAAPTLAAIRSDFPAIILGVVTPVRPPEASATQRGISRSLTGNADWSRHYLLDAELARSRLPDRIHTGRKPIRKPAHW